MKAVPYKLANDDDSQGCALGMMGKAATGYAHCVGQEFEWLLETMDTEAVPCGCMFNEYPASVVREQGLITYGFDGIVRYPINNYWGCIAHIFNQHVCIDKTWTIERLAEWIESVDPTPKAEESVDPVEHGLKDNGGAADPSRKQKTLSLGMTLHEIVDDVMSKHETKTKTGASDEEVDAAVPDAAGVSL